MKIEEVIERLTAILSDYKKDELNFLGEWIRSRCNAMVGFIIGTFFGACLGFVIYGLISGGGSNE